MRNDPVETLAAEIAQAGGRKVKDPKPSLSQTPAPRARIGEMRLPPGLCEEAAIMLFDFWEKQGAASRATKPTQWHEIAPRYQMMWIQITRIVLEMAVTVVLSDAHRFLDDSNGDMGAAFAKALRRYSAEVLNSHIKE
jgi:hypothetical protein